MAKSSSRVNWFGSIGRCLKHVTVAALLLVSSSSYVTKAEESNYKIRIHKNLMQNVIDKNLPIALSHIEARANKDIIIDAGARIDNINLRIEPMDEKNWEKVQTDLFFD